jgi:hypothetical protein
MAADPGRAELVLAMHGDVPGVVEAFAAGMAKLGGLGREYYELGGCLVTAQTKRRLEELVAKSPIISTDWAKKHVAQGREEGLAEGRVEGRVEGRIEADQQAILTVLEARKVEISPVDLQRIYACDDARKLREWLARAVTVDTPDELFE